MRAKTYAWLARPWQLSHFCIIHMDVRTKTAQWQRENQDLFGGEQNISIYITGVETGFGT